MPLAKWIKTELPTAAAKGGAPPQTTLAAIESLAVPLVQEVVFLADFRCSKCQQRVAEIMSRLNGETQSVMISVLEKKVTLSCIYQPADKLLRQKLTSAYRNSRSKLSLVARLFMSSCC
ncbi:uncharacterized protein [Henckelia pumila]|uniref:uncharacterized protein n=1 Tax=Henckelia pumila TaxID=405737 RepID=UPI003C6E25D6